MQQQWWVEFPDRWLREQRELTESGIQFVVNETAVARGQMALTLSWNQGDQSIALEAIYPLIYPYFPPTVIARGLSLRRHLHPETKQLCLLQREGEDWRPQSDTLASLLNTQLPALLASQDEAIPADESLEARQGEPVNLFLDPEPRSHVAFPEFDLTTLGARGQFLFALEQLKPLRGTVLEIRDDTGGAIWESQSRSHSYYASAPKIVGRWVALPRPPSAGGARHFYDVAIEADPSLKIPHWEAIPADNSQRIDLVALLFNDELAWRSWSGNVVMVSKTIAKKADALKGIDVRLHRVELESRRLYSMRSPRYASLAQSTISLIGVGSLGSVVGKYLAQAGVGDLRLFDKDFLEAGNAIRWELGQAFAGFTKVEALARHIVANYPYTKVAPFCTRIGQAWTDEGFASNDRLVHEQLFKGVNVVVDATASLPVNQFLSETARAKGIPYVWLHSTNGAWGGLVGRLSQKPGSICWMCHMYYLADGTIPALAAAPTEQDIQPPGCVEPTFTGEHVDLTEVALQAARTTVDVVLSSLQAPMPYTWNCATLRLRDDHGSPVLPAWRPYELQIHPSCPNH